ncbi:uncharacterized protein PHALS_07612 [Plasmopara halstedii]|uniref:Uncharacterized protein n=1 Tax=Plasmopara halstedii TaxID=4781 RepID=A0A0P1B5Y2_PLAHL|nr:uncharacterized protein PHALS_07612 [Plasmopara halstedii]CEG49874.1 hypothetical protein PHALS_07612 [Plasmopara halstedii]|eukprot:XP_024586243.1 hypothetical protein PHALS_07612 [Plasmopara halstedii]
MLTKVSGDASNAICQRFPLKIEATRNSVYPLELLHAKLEEFIWIKAAMAAIDVTNHVLLLEICSKTRYENVYK